MSFSAVSHRMIKLLATLVLSIILMIAGIGFSQLRYVQASSNTLIVNTLSDDQAPGGECSQSGKICLRNAIDTANHSGTSATTIGFSVSGTIALGSTLRISNSGNNPMTIDGYGQSIALDGGHKFQVLVTNQWTVTYLNAITIQDGNTDCNNYEKLGGGIENEGTLTITNSTVTNNTDPCGGSGGIFNSGWLTINSSTVSRNTNSKGFGGGIANGGNLTITKSTLFGNIANSVTDGNGGAIYNMDRLILSNSTISGNTASGTGGGIYGALRNADGYSGLNILSTIIAGNKASISPDLAGILNQPPSSLGHNLIGIGTGVAGLTNGVNGDQVGTSDSPISPMLGLPDLNGGLTQTMAPLTGSPAIGQGDCNGGYKIVSLHFDIPLTGVDQRGQSRHSPCDIGATESDSGTRPAITPIDTFTPSPTATIFATATSTPTVTLTRSPTVTATPTNASTVYPPITVTPIG